MEKNNLQKLYQSFTQSLNGLRTLPNSVFSASNFQKASMRSFHQIDKLREEYNNQYIQAIYENNELYDFFQTKVTAITEKMAEDLKKSNEYIQLEAKKVEDELVLANRSLVQKYKEYDASYLTKNNFLADNKQANKESYIKAVTAINTERTNKNHEYQLKCNDLDNKNEQIQFEFKHNGERFIEKHEQDEEEAFATLDRKLNEIETQRKTKEEELQKVITTKERLIVDNTIALNNSITKLSNDFENRRKYGFIPYDIEINNLRDEQNENGRRYSEVEENILLGFKAHLQKNDNDIETLREEHRTFEANFQKKLAELKQDYEVTVFTKSKPLDEQIKFYRDAFIEKRNNADYKKHQMLVREERLLLAQLKREYDIKVLSVKYDYFIRENDYIRRFEILRTEKSKFETIKSNAMKNLNAERDISLNLSTNQLSLKSKEKESFFSRDHYEENKAVLKLRLDRDIENAKINYVINEVERDIKQNNYLEACYQEETKAETQYQRDLAEIDLQYQQAILKNRCDFANVNTMLEIQAYNIENKYENDVCYAKMDFEKTKFNFYTECDRTQYQIYKLTHEYYSRSIDAQIELKKNLAENKKVLIEAIGKFEERTIKNLSDYNEAMARIDLYTKRFDIEQTILRDVFQFFSQAIEKIVDIENQLLEKCSSFDEGIFQKYSKNIFTCIEYLHQMKLLLLEDYYENETKIINSRINFEKDVKYTKSLENIKAEKENCLQQFATRKSKLLETIHNYQNAITVFKANISNLNHENESLVKKIRELRHLSKYKNKEEIKALYHQIDNNNLRINTLLLQIKTNDNNIVELKKKVLVVTKDIHTYTLKYDRQIKLLHHSQELEAKVYYDTITIIKQQNNQLKTKLETLYLSLSPSNLTYQKLSSVCSSGISSNSKFILDIDNLFDSHLNYLINAVSNEIKVLENNYTSTYERNDTQIFNSKNNEIGSNTAKAHTIQNAHISSMKALSKNYELERNNQYLFLKNLNTKQQAALMAFDNKLTQLQTNYQYNHQCHLDNEKFYEADYNKKNAAIRKNYMKQVNDAKIKRNAEMKRISNNRKNFAKSDKVQRTSNLLLRKNTIEDTISEYKENVEHTNLRIKEINHNDRLEKIRVELLNKNTYQQYITTQKHSRFDFLSLLHEIDSRCEKRIIISLKEFKKSFWKK